MFSRADLPNGISLRPTQPGDRDFERLLHSARRWDLWLVDGEDDFIHTLVAQQHAAQTRGYATQFPNAMYFVIEKTGVACGRLVVDLTQDVHVVDIALLPEAQGSSIGTTVLQAMQRVGAEIPAPVTLAVHCLNTPAIRMYQRLGFEPSASDVGPVHVAMEWRPEALRDSRAAFTAEASNGHAPGGGAPNGEGGGRGH